MGRSFGSADVEFAWIYFGLLIIAALNTAVSAGYYLKILRAMMLDEPTEDGVLRVSIGGRLLVILLTGLVILGGILWDPITRLTDRCTRSFESPPVSAKENRS
jgi:NADH-quinone oxidoreductase subunit N